MQQLQMIGISPDALADLIDNRLQTRFKDVLTHLKTNEPKVYLTRKEVAEMLSVDVSSVHNMTVKGILQKYQISGRVLYKRDEVENSIVKLNK